MVSGQDFLGRGWGFPICFDAHDKSVQIVSDDLDIEQSLTILFGTRPGERVMQPDYGCALHALVFEVLNQRTVSEIKEAIERAILFFEPRIQLDTVAVDSTQAAEGILLIRVDYRIRTTNTRSNIVYPFYLREGTNVRL